MTGCDAAEVVTVFLVRHAEALPRAGWSADDRLRPLSAEGEVQAAGLVRHLAGSAVARVLSSPTVRCRQTVGPLAADRGLGVEDDDALLEGGGHAPALRLLAAAGDGGTVLCSHGDVVSGLVLAIRDAGVPLEGGPRWEKGATWVLDVERGAVVRARYLPPPAL